MKSKTSFFNPSLLRKDIVRFAPAWVLYGAFLLLVFSGSILGYDRAGVANALSGSIGAFGLFNLFYAMLCAQLLFGDLFQSRMCNALHALPSRREGWFITHVLAGLTFCAIPVAAAGLVFLAVLGSYWMAGLLWMAALILQFVFFFAVAVLSTMLVGNRFAAIVVYCIFNFLSAIVLWLFGALYQPHLYGFILNEQPFLQLCPVVWMIQFSWFDAIPRTGTVLLQDSQKVFLADSAKHEGGIQIHVLAAKRFQCFTGHFVGAAMCQHQLAVLHTADQFQGKMGRATHGLIAERAVHARVGDHDHIVFLGAL